MARCIADGRGLFLAKRFHRLGQPSGMGRFNCLFVGGRPMINIHPRKKLTLRSVGIAHVTPNSFGSLATFTAMRRASSKVSTSPADASAALPIEPCRLVSLSLARRAARHSIIC